MNTRFVPLLLLASAILSACDRSPTEPSVDGLVINEIILEMDDGSYAYSHNDHWHGAPVLSTEESLGIRFHFVEEQMSPTDHDIPPVEGWFTLADQPEYSIHVVIEDESLAAWSGDRTQGGLLGLGPGASRISFVVRRGPTTVYEAPPLNFRVQAAEE